MNIYNTYVHIYAYQSEAINCNVTVISLVVEMLQLSLGSDLSIVVVQKWKGTRLESNRSGFGKTNIDFNQN